MVVAIHKRALGGWGSMRQLRINDALAGIVLVPKTTWLRIRIGGEAAYLIFLRNQVTAIQSLHMHAV